MSTDDTTAGEILCCLPHRCDVMTLDSLTGDRSHTTKVDTIEQVPEIARLLKTGYLHAKAEQHNVELHKVRSATPREVSESPVTSTAPLLVEWKTDEEIPIRVQPAPTLVRFAADKTYWLVGLTGGLGLSICRWMIDRGAKYIVMTCRNPKIEASWLDEVKALGATVQVFANDITDRKAVQDAYQTICTTMPPIAGVAQGAMVLQDAMFADMDLDAVERVMKPKVNGSIHLDEIFHDSPLDFFIFFSSVAAISGNKGQSIYGAANIFMHALAAQRLQRGFAGSVIDIGCVMGNGYVTRELTEQQQQYLEDVGNVWPSEQDFLTIFAEAVLASPPGATDTMGFLTGLKIQNGKSEKVSWTNNPMFQHLVQKTTIVTAAEASKAGGMPLKQQLEGAKAEDVQMIIGNAFAAKLRSALQADVDREILGTALDELGMDSLVAVEVRSWFLKELSVDIPILKILKASSPNTLLESVWSSLPEELIGSKEPSEQLQAEQVPQNEVVSHSLPDGADTSLPRDPEAPENELSTRTLLQSNSRDSADMTSSEDDLDSGSVSSAPEEALPIVNSCERTVPMSFGQSRFWFLTSYIEDQAAFNITVLIKLRGNLDVESFTKAFDAVTERHQSLRTSFDSAANQPVQTVWKHSSIKLHSRSVEDESTVKKCCGAIHKHIYALNEGDTMRAELLSLSSSTHFLVLGYHHINMDGVALEVLVSELEKAYNNTTLTGDILQYADFAIKERQQYANGQWSSEIAFWHEEFPELPEPIPLLPLSKRSSRPEAPGYSTLKAERNVEAGLGANIKQACRKFNVTPYHFHLATLSALLARYTETEDFCIDLGDANRKDPDVRESLGLHLNLVPLRVRCNVEKAFSQAIKEMQRKSQEVFANSSVPFDVLLSELKVPRSPSHAPLFQVFMNYRQGIRQMRSFCGCDCEGELIGGGQVAYDISIDVIENPGGEALVTLSVQQDLYDQVHAEILLDSYFNLLHAFADNPAARLKRPALHSQTSIDDALAVGSSPSQRYIWPPTISHRIDDMVNTYPTRVALTDSKGLSQTYRTMSQRVNQICATLQANSITGIVGVFQSPTPDFVCSILAILKIGLTYVPLDPRAGLGRLAAIVSECRPASILVDTFTKGEVAIIRTQSLVVIDISSLPPTPYKDSPTTAQPDDTAAVIFTSGSTGTPKGICLSHASLRNNLELATRQFNYNEGIEVTLGQCAFSFDMSLAQTFTTLCNGGTLVVVPRELRGDSAALASLIRTEHVTWTQATPSEYISWIQHGSTALKYSSWRFACAGSEKIGSALLECFKSLENEELVLCDAYGPAEITFSCNSKVVSYRDANPKPQGLATWPNYAIYILDKDLKPVPKTVPGEIYIAGAGLVTGYLHKPDLTSEQFIHNPYASSWFTSQGWVSMYRTGDQGRLSSEGNLLLEGRIEGDTQIKLRGIRIDFRDIEAAIFQSSAGEITDCAVSARDQSGTGYLVAHVVLKRPQNAAWLQQLQARLPLPQYMKPSCMVPISKLPTNDSNKLDWKALTTLIATEETPPVPISEELTVQQIEMRSLWAQVIPEVVMNSHEVGPGTDFFHAGGSSLLLVNLQSLLKQKLEHPPPLHELFEAPTLESMAILLDDSSVDSPVQHINWEQEAELLPDDVYDLT